MGRLAEAFGMKILTFNHDSTVTLPDLFIQSDFITLHVPLTPDTRNMINLDLFKVMKKTGYLIRACPQFKAIN